MVTLSQLWLPILLSAIFAFIASSILHMVLTYHNSDFNGLPSESKIMDALREFAISPGEYYMPWAKSQKEMAEESYQKKAEEGPVIMMTVMENGMPDMKKSLSYWFIYCLVVSLFAAYVASRTLTAGTPYLEVFRIVGTVAFAGYALALWQNTIWYKRKWSTTLKSNIDSLIYALLAGGTFGWLWP